MLKKKNIFIRVFVVYILIFVFSCSTDKFSLENDDVIKSISISPEGIWPANGASERFVIIELVDNVQEISILATDGNGTLFYENRSATSEIKLTRSDASKIGNDVIFRWRSSTCACCGIITINVKFHDQLYTRLLSGNWTAALPDYLGVAVSPNPITSPQNEATFTVTAFDAMGGFASDNTQVAPEATPGGGTTGFWNSNTISIKSGTGTGVWYITTFPAATSTVVFKATYPQATIEASVNLVVNP